MNDEEGENEMDEDEIEEKEDKKEKNNKPKPGSLLPLKTKADLFLIKREATLLTIL